MSENKNPTDDGIFEALRAIPPACLLDVLSPLGYTKLFMKGVKSFSKNEKLVARAVTLRFIPTRVDLKEAIRSCGKFLINPTVSLNKKS